MPPAPDIQTMPKPGPAAPPPAAPRPGHPAAPPPPPPLGEHSMVTPIIIAVLLAIAAGTGSFAAAWFFLPRVTAEDLNSLSASADSRMDALEERVNDQVETMNDNFATNKQEVLDEVERRLGSLAITVTPEQPLTYRNLDYGFTLTFPETWAGYAAAPAPASLVDTSVASIRFGLPVQETLFVVRVYAPAEWQSISSAEGPKPVFMAENDQYVFVYDRPSDLMPAAQARGDEIPSIVGTFALTQ